MSMLRFLTGAKGKSQPLLRGSLVTATSSDSQIQLKVIVQNWGVIYLPQPAEEGVDSTEPREDYPFGGELEITLPLGSGPKRCKSIRVGLRTMITLDLGHGRRFEEDVLFERKVEIISSTADGIWLEEGVQRFDFTIIVPANLASHDWHPNGVITHSLYAEVEGLPDPNESTKAAATTSLFSLRRPTSRSSSRGASRGASPTASPPLSPSIAPPPRMARTSSSFSLSSPTTGAAAQGYGPNADALANLISPTPTTFRRSNGVSSPIGSRTGSPGVHSRSGSPSAPGSSSTVGGGTRRNPAHISGAQSMSITRQEEVILPRVPSYDDSMSKLKLNESSVTLTPGWIIGKHTAKRNCMVIYNPHPSGGVNELSERANGYIDGLGLWSWTMMSDVWCIGALLSFNFHLSQLSPTTTIFSVQLLLNQTHSIVSPRDMGGDAQHESTRTFTLLSEGKRPAEGYYFPDKRHPAIWRGKDASGTREGGEITIDTKCRMPNDNVARPSTLPGVVTPISVKHSIVLEVAFSVWGEDDLGNKMDIPTFGGLRLLKVSRPVIVPSCCLVPAYLDLPRYESHANDRVAGPSGPSELLPTTLPGWEWCACGSQILELESRMRQSTLARLADEEAAVADNGGMAPSLTVEAEQAKLVNERGRQRSGR